MQLDAVLVTRSLRCPRCASHNIGTMRGADLDGAPARRCKACGAGFRVLLVDSVDVVAAIAERPPATGGDAAATVYAATELAAAEDEADDEDRELAAEALRGWRVRLAAIRTQKRLDEDAAPFDEDLALLERATAADVDMAGSGPGCR